MKRRATKPEPMPVPLSLLGERETEALKRAAIAKLDAAKPSVPDGRFRAGYLAAFADLRRELAPLAAGVIALEGPVPARAAVFEVVAEIVTKLEASAR